MEFTIRPGSYDDPALDAELPQALEQRLAARSRQVMPGMWAVTDKLNAHAARGPGREKHRRQNRICGVLLLAMAVFVLVPGLMEPQVPTLIGAGLFALAAGLFCLWISSTPKPAAPPAACRREAAQLLDRLRGVDWTAEENRTELQFGAEGIVFLNGEDVQRQVPWSSVTGFFETAHLWLLVYGGEQALVLQKKDLIAGDAPQFPAYLQTNITNHAIETDKESIT